MAKKKKVRGINLIRSISGRTKNTHKFTKKRARIKYEKVMEFGALIASWHEEKLYCVVVYDFDREIAAVVPTLEALRLGLKQKDTHYDIENEVIVAFKRPNKILFFRVHRQKAKIDFLGASPQGKSAHNLEEVAKLGHGPFHVPREGTTLGNLYEIIERDVKSFKAEEDQSKLPDLLTGMAYVERQNFLHEAPRKEWTTVTRVSQLLDPYNRGESILLYHPGREMAVVCGYDIWEIFGYPQWTLKEVNDEGEYLVGIVYDEVIEIGYIEGWSDSVRYIHTWEHDNDDIYQAIKSLGLVGLGPFNVPLADTEFERLVKNMLSEKEKCFS